MVLMFVTYYLRIRVIIFQTLEGCKLGLTTIGISATFFPIQIHATLLFMFMYI